MELWEFHDHHVSQQRRFFVDLYVFSIQNTFLSGNCLNLSPAGLRSGVTLHRAKNFLRRRSKWFHGATDRGFESYRIAGFLAKKKNHYGGISRSTLNQYRNSSPDHHFHGSFSYTTSTVPTELVEMSKIPQLKQVRPESSYRCHWIFHWTSLPPLQTKDTNNTNKTNTPATDAPVLA